MWNVPVGRRSLFVERRRTLLGVGGVAVTLLMCQAGMTLPALSLRWPVSISWLMSTRTVALPPADWARIRMGSDMDTPEMN